MRGWACDLNPTEPLTRPAGEDGARCGDAAQRVFAQRHRRRGGLGRDRDRDQHRPAERPAQPLHPAKQVDRGADRGEVQPVGRADMAPQDLAQMQRRAEGQRRQPCACRTASRWAMPARAATTARSAASQAGAGAPAAEDTRVLVDRLWPRELSRERAGADLGGEGHRAERRLATAVPRRPDGMEINEGRLFRRT